MYENNSQSVAIVRRRPASRIKAGTGKPGFLLLNFNVNSGQHLKDAKEKESVY